MSIPQRYWKWGGLLVVLVALGAMMHGQDPGTAVPTSAEEKIDPTLGDEAVSGSSMNDPVGEWPPEEWKSSLEEIKQKARVTLLFPEHEDLDRNSLRAAYLLPDSFSSVSFQFPQPTAPAAPVRIDGLWVTLQPWRSGNALTDYQSDIALDPSLGKFVCEVRGGPALCVEAHTDALGTNAAFVRFVEGERIEVQLTGGDDLAYLIDVANSLERM